MKLNVTETNFPTIKFTCRYLGPETHDDPTPISHRSVLHVSGGNAKHDSENITKALATTNFLTEELQWYQQQSICGYWSILCIPHK